MSQLIDLTGKRFGRLTVIGRAGTKEYKTGKKVIWACQCDCGNTCNVIGANLKHGDVKSCGCLNQNPGPVKDITGQMFGFLKVISYETDINQKTGKTKGKWLCQCTKCGNYLKISRSNLTHHKQIACRCILKRNGNVAIKEDLTGQKFNMLTVIRRTEDHIAASGKPSARWLCKCDCGNETIVSGTKLKKGTTKSCGCYQFNSKLQERIGQETIAKNTFLKMKIIRYKNVNDVDVQFEDGIVVEHTTYAAFSQGYLLHPGIKSKSFHGFTILNKAFDMTDKAYYYIINPEGIHDIMTPQQMILADNTK